MAGDSIIWPASPRAAAVLITLMKLEDAKHAEVAEGLARQLNGAGVDVLLDDREERAGVKFKDADLVGLPIRLTIGDKALEQGGVEFKTRRDTGKGEVVRLDVAVERVLAALNAKALRRPLRTTQAA